MQLLDRLLITLQSGIYSFSVDNDPSYILLIKGLLHFPKGEMPTRTNSDRKKDVISFFFSYHHKTSGRMQQYYPRSKYWDFGLNSVRIR